MKILCTAEVMHFVQWKTMLVS